MNPREQKVSPVAVGSGASGSAARCPKCSGVGYFVRTRYFDTEAADVWECQSPLCSIFGLLWHVSRPYTAEENMRRPLVALPGQPLCAHFTGAVLADLRGDYECRCRAGIPYERWTIEIDRWPCRRRHLLGLEQHTCASAQFGSDIAADIDEQLQQNTRDDRRRAPDSTRPNGA